MNTNSDRNCATADSAKIGTYTDGGSFFVTYMWDDGEAKTIPYINKGDAMESLRSMGFGS